MHPTLSIIIPTFQAESTLEKALKSVAAQTFKDLEVLIMDGGSTDETPTIAKKFIQQFSYAKFFSDPDEGIYDAMNKGIDHAKGDWIYFLGSDDELYDSTVLEKVFGNRDVIGNADIIYGQVLLMGLNKLYFGKFNGEKLIFHNISHQAIFTRKAIFERLGKFDTKYKICADHIFNVKWFFDKHVKKKYIDIIIAKFGQQGVSSQKDDFEKSKDLPSLVLKHGGWIVYFRYYLVRPIVKWSKKKINSCKKLLLRFAPIII